MVKKYSLMMTLIFCALLAQAQESPTESSAQADPLDVLETPAAATPAQPTVPEFTEVPLPAKETAPTVNPTPTVVESTPATGGSSEEPAPPVRRTPRRARSKPVSTIAPTTVGSEPDSNMESEFHRIYKTFNEDPTPVENWEKAVGARSSEIYQVQSGDTLSGISTVFFGDQHYWPKIWSLNNGQILNPHEIDPGMAVRFFPGSMEDAPTLSLASAADAVGAENTGTVTDAPSPQAAGVAIPKGKRKTPLLKKLPPSLPASQGRTLTSGDNVEVTLDLNRFQFPAAMEYLEYYLTDAPIVGAGVITGTELDTKTAGDFQYIYVRMESGAQKELIAQKNMTQVEDPKNKNRLGQMVEIQGQIELLEKVNEQTNTYRAIVKKAINPIEVGAIVSPGKLPMIDPQGGDFTTGVGASIMGGQFDRKRQIFGTNATVFLDAGSRQGLQVGQSLPVYADGRLRNKGSGAIINDRIIGALKIVRVSESFATAYVTKATDDIRVGDYVGRVANVATVEAVEEGPSSSSDSFSGDDLDVPAASSSDDVVPDSGAEEGELEL